MVRAYKPKFVSAELKAQLAALMQEPAEALNSKGKDKCAIAAGKSGAASRSWPIQLERLETSKRKLARMSVASGFFLPAVARLQVTAVAPGEAHALFQEPSGHVIGHAAGTEAHALFQEPSGHVIGHAAGTEGDYGNPWWTFGPPIPGVPERTFWAFVTEALQGPESTDALCREFELEPSPEEMAAKVSPALWSRAEGGLRLVLGDAALPGGAAEGVCAVASTQQWALRRRARAPPPPRAAAHGAPPAAEGRPARRGGQQEAVAAAAASRGPRLSRGLLPLAAPHRHEGGLPGQGHFPRGGVEAQKGGGSEHGQKVWDEGTVAEMVE
ncbi:unnamed protein product, partial [Prorocentrum cordatum]